MKFIVSHPSSNQFSRSLIGYLNHRGLLVNFYTAIAVFPSQWVYKLGAINALKDINRRSFDQGLKTCTVSNPWLEIGRLLAPKFKMNALLAHEIGFFSTDKIYQNHDHWVAKKLGFLKNEQLDAVYAYEDAALETFKKAKSKGLKCIYDLPIAYWETGRELMQEEAKRYPHWQNTMIGGTSDSKSKTNRKIEELKLADYIVVPSFFVKNSLPAWVNKDKVIMSPFGSPITKNEVTKNKIGHRKLRVLFAGSMTQRKGLADLFAAMKLVDQSKVELVVLGSLIEPMSFYRKEYNDFIYESTRPHEDVLKLMQSCDVFCLPSIVEGRAQVMQEAMSQGLPIIITPNTGGEDLVTDQTGFLVPIRNPKAIADKIEWFYNHLEQIETMSQAAIVKAASITWVDYAKNIVEGLSK